MNTFISKNQVRLYVRVYYTLVYKMKKKSLVSHLFPCLCENEKKNNNLLFDCKNS